jgi:T5SS/PEP-CTERM-associated repeat protein
MALFTFNEATVTVTGAGSTWTNNGSLRVANRGAATLTIEDGGTMSTGSTIIGELAGSDGSVTVSGPGSSFNNSGDLTIGDSGTGTLTIEGGATVANNLGAIGAFAGSTGEATVTGAGSTWVNNHNLTVGTAGAGTLTVNSGGVASVAGLLIVGSQGELHGDGTIDGNVSNGGLVIPGMSPGTLHIDGNYHQTGSGKTIIELSSTASFDSLDVTGHLALGGELEVLLVDGYVPTPGTNFDILNWATRNGTFNTLILPGVVGWNTSQLYTTGVLSVVGPSPTGDYNNDGRVDAADYIVWRKTDGSSEGFNIWRANFGATIGSGSAEALHAVPEPRVIRLTVAWATFACLSRRRRPTYNNDTTLTLNAMRVACASKCPTAVRSSSPF